MHSHLLPGLDDGVKTFEESLKLVASLKAMGYKKLIITPHIISDIYRNTPEAILQKHDELRWHLTENNMDMETTVAAEYYLDESLMQKIRDKEKLLTFGDRYLLFETNFLSEPLNLKEFIFLASTSQYKLILAHPERYLYLHDKPELAEDLLNRGVLFQVNINSLSGFYSKAAQSMAYKLIDRGWVHWLGTDCHHEGHAGQTRQTISNKYFQKALTLPLLNNSLS